MAHAIVEWTDNLEDQGFSIGPLLQLIATAMRETGGVFPVGGIRVRGIKLSDYVIADGAGGDAFINIEVKMAAGRPAEFRKTFFTDLFDAIQEHLGDLNERVPLALSLYVIEMCEDQSFKANTIHRRLGRR